MELNQGIVIIIGLPLLMLVVFIRDVKRKNKKEYIDYNREFIWILFVIYILLLISLFIFPLKIDLKNDLSRPDINIIPLMYTLEKIKTFDLQNKVYIITFLKTILSHMLIVLPIGMFLPILYKKFKDFKIIIISGFIISFGIEGTKYMLYYLGNGEIFSIDNIILRVLGILLGYFIYHIFMIKINKFLFENI